MNLRLPITEHLEMDQIFEKVAKGFDRELLKNPKDERSKDGKFLLNLRFEKFREADQMCQKWIHDNPAGGYPRFTHAHLQCRLGKRDFASKEFEEWVFSHGSFSNYILLFLFEMREMREAQAIEAAKSAFSYPLEDKSAPVNEFYLGHNAAVFTFQPGDFKLCRLMCEKLLADPRQKENYSRLQILKTLAAASAMLGDASQAKNLLFEREKLLKNEYQIDEDRDRDKKLTIAIKTGNLAIVRNYDNWKDFLDHFYSPFDTDETGIHGREDIPNPYPKVQSVER